MSVTHDIRGLVPAGNPDELPAELMLDLSPILLLRRVWPVVSSRAGPPEGAPSRRELLRVPLCLEADLWVPRTTTGREELIPAVIADLSGGGFQVRTIGWVPVGLQVRARFKVPVRREEQQFDVRGRVVWTESLQQLRLCRSGIEMIQIEESTRSRIVQFVLNEQIRRHRYLSK